MSAVYGNPASPANQAIAVTPSDTTVLATTRALYVGTAGNLTVTMAGPDANDVVFSNIPSGAVLPIMVSKVKAATTASNIVALW